MRSIGQLIALARLTAAEAMRQPVCLLLAATCVVATALCPMLLMHSMGEGGRLARDGGLAFHFVFGVFIAGYAACSSLSGEKQRGTTVAVLCKPVSRVTFFLATFAGIVMVVALFSFSATLATILAERVAEKHYETDFLSGYSADWRTAQLLLAAPVVAFALGAVRNFRARHAFQSSAFVLLAVTLAAVLGLSGFYDEAGHRAPYALHVAWSTLPASFAITLALIMLAALALALSVRFAIVPTMTFCALVLAVGLVAEHWTVQLHAGEWASAVVSALLPNWQRFWLADLLVGNAGVWRAVAGAAMYAGTYTAAVLAVGVALFGESEVSA